MQLSSVRALAHDAATGGRLVAHAHEQAGPAGIPLSDDAFLRALPMRSADSLEQADWQRIHDLRTAGVEYPDSELLVAANRVQMLDTAAHWMVSNVAVDEQQRMRRYADHAFAIWRLGNVPANERTARIAELLDRGSGSVDQATARELGALLDADVERYIPLPRHTSASSTIVDLLNHVSTGRPIVQAELDRYFDAWRLLRTAPEHRLDETTQLLGRPAKELTVAEVDRLALLLDVDIANHTGIPRSMGSTTLRSVLGSLLKTIPEHRSAVARTEAALVEIQRVSPARTEVSEAGRAVATLRERPIGGLADEELEQLRRELFFLHAAIPTPAWNEFSTSVTTLQKATEDVQLYRWLLDEYRVAQELAATPVADRVSAAGNLLARDPASLDGADWRQLKLLLAADTERAIPVVRELPHALDLDRMAAMASGEPVRFPEARQYFATWQVGRLDDAARSAAATRIATTDPAKLTPRDIDHLRELVRTDPSGELGIPRVLPGRQRLDDLLEALQHQDDANNRSIVLPKVGDYLAARTLSTAPRAERIAEAKNLLERPIADVGPDEARQLRQLLVSTGLRTLGDNHPSGRLLSALDKVTYAMNDFLPAARADLDEARAAFRLHDLPVGRVADELRTALAEPAGSPQGGTLFGALQWRDDQAEILNLLTPRESLELAARLDVPSSKDVHHMQSALGALRSALDVARAGGAIPQELMPLATRARDELAVQLQRAYDGRWPDYARIGALRADLRTIATITNAADGAITW